MSEIERFARDWDKNVARALARSEALEEARLKREAEERLARSQIRTRLAIERQCRKRYYRDKYTALGLWPLPPLGTPINT